jgi:hypothetical protein
MSTKFIFSIRSVLNCFDQLMFPVQMHYPVLALASWASKLLCICIMEACPYKEMSLRSPSHSWDLYEKPSSSPDCRLTMLARCISRTSCWTTSDIGGRNSGSGCRTRSPQYINHSWEMEKWSYKTLKYFYSLTVYCKLGSQKKVYCKLALLTSRVWFCVVKQSNPTPK